MKKLINMVDYILKFNKDFLESDEFEETYVGVYDYAVFLNQPLKLEMFVPCDNKGNVLKEPIEDEYNLGDIHAGYFRQECEQYQQALKKVIFSEFEDLANDGISMSLCNDKAVELYYSFKNGFRLNGSKIETIQDIIHLKIELNKEI